MFLLAKYGTQTSFTFPVVKRAVVDLAVSADWTPATGDTKLSKDGATVANTTNNPAAVAGTGSALWTITLTATELQCAEAVVQIVDSATKAIEDQVIRVYTYGNASAKIPVDLSDTVRMGLTALPNAAAEAAGGLYTRGTGAGQINQDANGRINSNAVAMSGTALTARDIGASVLLSSGTGTGQVSLSSGAVAIQSGFKRNASAVIPFIMKDTTGAPWTTGTVTVTYKQGTATTFSATNAVTATEAASGCYFFTATAAEMNAQAVQFLFSPSGGSGTGVANVLTVFTDP